MADASGFVTAFDSHGDCSGRAGNFLALGMGGRDSVHRSRSVVSHSILGTVSLADIPLHSRPVVLHRSIVLPELALPKGTPHEHLNVRPGQNAIRKIETDQHKTKVH